MSPELGPERRAFATCLASRYSNEVSSVAAVVRQPAVRQHDVHIVDDLLKD